VTSKLDAPFFSRSVTSKLDAPFFLFKYSVTSKIDASSVKINYGDVKNRRPPLEFKKKKKNILQIKGPTFSADPKLENFGSVYDHINISFFN
jgi:hypothetical protein